MSYTCPSGTLRAGEAVSNLSECNVEANTSLMPTIWNGISVAIGVIGVAAVIVIIMGGVTYVTSQGDAGKVTKAKNTIIYGVIGLVISILAFAIVNFVLRNVFVK
ncbi:hypothetical protein J6S39_00680 [Candidatus Saccharibacteria bacterium]|nr:hypothetical protein [Candidatus Saccharibacteria bacterium]